jgi:protein-disulfide isomerase
MFKKMVFVNIGLGWFVLALFSFASAAEDNIGRMAIEIFKKQARLPEGAEIKYLERIDSPIPGFYGVICLLLTAGRETPVMIFVDESGEKVILGNLFIKGENFNAQAARYVPPKKIDMSKLEIEKSPFWGAKDAKVTIVEFANFECSHCQDSWMIFKDFMGEHQEQVRYVFKHFPFQTQGKAFELAEMAAAAQEVSNEAFWAVHDFLFSPTGQAFATAGKEAVKRKLEQILQEKGYDLQAFRSALGTGRGKKRVEEDMAVGNRIRVSGTPTKIVNGDIIVGSTPDKVLEQYLNN